MAHFVQQLFEGFPSRTYHNVAILVTRTAILWEWVLLIFGALQLQVTNTIKVFTPKSAALFVSAGVALFFYFRHEKAKLLEQRGEGSQLLR